MEPNDYLNQLIAEHASFDNMRHLARAIATVCRIDFAAASMLCAARWDAIRAGINFTAWTEIE
jgi:hypothetical protein